MNPLRAIRELRNELRKAGYRDALALELRSVPAMARTLPWLARAQMGQTLVDALIRNASQYPHGLAWEMGDERYRWSEVDRWTSQIARALRAQGMRSGDIVALQGPSSPMYLALVLGIARAGATAALINTQLADEPLRHAIGVAKARLALVSSDHAAFPELTRCIRYGNGELEGLIASESDTPLEPARPTTDQDFVLIFTSGTTGMPKPCRISHGRALLAAAGFGLAVFELRPDDKLYNVLPLYHGNGLLLGAGACIVTGTPMAMRSKLSVSEFWPDVKRYGATAFLYIGELCRFLVQAPVQPDERDNPLRIIVGNGMRADVWRKMVQRFGIQTVREFYGATESPAFTVNLTGKVGAVGRMFVPTGGRMRLARYEVTTDEHIRDPRGFLVDAAANEPAELLVEVSDAPWTVASEFRGYADAQATRDKLLENVFEHGDKYFRSGDLLRRDESGFLYFVDRIGDTFRWKGENVATAEVEAALMRVPGITEACVVGVEVPHMEGRAGLAVLVSQRELDLDVVWEHARKLPDYAQPRFLRHRRRLMRTATFKLQKATLREAGVGPSTAQQPTWVRTETGYEVLSEELWNALLRSDLRI